MYLRVSRDAYDVSHLAEMGHSVGVQLPKPMPEQVGLREGSPVEVRIDGDHLAIRPVPRPTLAELLAQCKPENRPDPIDWGPDVGREIIDD